MQQSMANPRRYISKAAVLIEFTSLDWEKLGLEVRPRGCDILII